MKVKQIYKFQDGGVVPAEAPAPEAQAAPAPQEGTQDPIQQIAGQLVEMLLQQVQDPQAVVAILQTALDMVQQAAAPQQPVYQRQGGSIVRVK